VLHGAGQDIVADVPIIADVTAGNVGGLMDAHATGRAMAHARIRLSIARDWRAHGTIALAYDWSTPPGIDLLGQRITFTDKADESSSPSLPGWSGNCRRNSNAGICAGRWRVFGARALRCSA
jgi:hypothetical protein